MSREMIWWLWVLLQGRVQAQFGPMHLTLGPDCLLHLTLPARLSEVPWGQRTGHLRLKCQALRRQPLGDLRGDSTGWSEFKGREIPLSGGTEAPHEPHCLCYMRRSVWETLVYANGRIWKWVFFRRMHFRGLGEILGFSIWRATLSIELCSGLVEGLLTGVAGIDARGKENGLWWNCGFLLLRSTGKCSSYWHPDKEACTVLLWHM